ncbi:MAG TPA: ribonuclease P protein component [Prevotella sp.]|nr:ribonuclease P protein component [Prevotella sp.]
MSITYPATLHKEERICSHKLIDAIFAGNKSRSMSAFPLRVVYMPLEEPEAGDDTHGDEDDRQPKRLLPKAKMLISVPKKHFKRAVKRNRVKRQVREAYRKNKSLIADKAVALAFIWTDGQLYDSKVVEDRVVNLLTRVREKLERGLADKPHNHG